MSSFKGVAYGSTWRKTTDQRRVSDKLYHIHLPEAEMGSHVYLWL